MVQMLQPQTNSNPTALGAYKRCPSTSAGTVLCAAACRPVRSRIQSRLPEGGDAVVLRQMIDGCRMGKRPGVPERRCFLSTSRVIGLCGKGRRALPALLTDGRQPLSNQSN